MCSPHHYRFRFFSCLTRCLDMTIVTHTHKYSLQLLKLLFNLIWKKKQNKKQLNVLLNKYSSKCTFKALIARALSVIDVLLTKKRREEEHNFKTNNNNCELRDARKRKRAQHSSRKKQHLFRIRSFCLFLTGLGGKIKPCL